MKNVLVVVEPSTTLPSVFETAFLVAQRFDSCLEGYHLLQSSHAVASVQGIGTAPTLIASFEREARERAEALRRDFEGFVGGKGVALSDWDASVQGVTATWRQQEASSDAPIGDHGRLFDLIVLGRPTDGELTPTMAALETAVFDSGRPVLVAPPTPPIALGETIVIAWNGSAESARAVALAMPFLEQARSVHVLAVEGGSVPGPNAGEVAEMLRRHRIPAQAAGVRPEDQSVGAAILSEAAGLGADLLVKGAYTHGRLRQLIFGGATRHIIHNAELPVLMAH